MQHSEKVSLLKRKEFIIFLILVGALTAVAVFVYNTEVLRSYIVFDPTVSGSAAFLEVYFWILSVIVIAGSAAIYYFTFIKKIKLFYVVMAMLLLLGTVSMFVMTPNTVPDEIVHYETAYRFSNDMMGLGHSNDAGQIEMQNDDYQVILDFSNTMNAENYAKMLEQFGSDPENPETWGIEGADTSGNAVLGFIASGLGVTLARIAGASPLAVYYAGRIFNLLLYVFLVTLAVRKIPFGKVTLAAIAMIPIMMQQAASYSYDSVTNGIVIFFIAYCLYIAYADAKPRWWEWALMLCAAVMIIPLKYVYVPIAGLFFLIPTSKFGSLKIKLIVYAVIIAGVAAFLAKFASGIGGGNYLEYADANAYSASYITEHPGGTAAIIANTVNDNFMYYLSSAIAGYFGWLEVQIPDAVSVVFVALIAFSLFINRQDPLSVGRYKITNRIWMLVLAFLSIILVYISLMISWTPENMTLILGIQGRYFLPILPLCFLAFWQRKERVSFKKDYSAVYLFSVMMLSLLAFTLVFMYAV